MSETKCLDILLKDYKEGNFELSSKLLSYEDSSGKYLPLSERIKMFRADNPGASIQTKILCDNNIFATVECTVTTESCSVKAVSKYYHTNSDAFGMNYLSTAQSNALSIALKWLGYDYNEKPEPDPAGNTNIGEVELLLPPIDSSGYYPDKITGYNKPAPVKKSISDEDVLNTKIPNPPFANRTIQEILQTNNSEELKKLKEILEFSVKHNTPLSKAAKVALSWF